MLWAMAYRPAYNVTPGGGGRPKFIVLIVNPGPIFQKLQMVANNRANITHSYKCTILIKETGSESSRFLTPGTFAALKVCCPKHWPNRYVDSGRVTSIGRF